MLSSRTLDSIYQFMKQEAEQKWGARLMRKSTIENALTEHNAALDDAARGFQVSSFDPSPRIYSYSLRDRSLL